MDILTGDALTGQDALGLYELNRRIREHLAAGFPDALWITAEISELNLNRNGHCYLELIEKESDGDRILARSRATIWSTTYRMLKPYFETTTGQELVPGLKVMVKVVVEFHELYSISLNIRDIEPSFTIGELARKRMLILKKLEEAGVLDMNRETTLSIVPQKIAIISSPTAAGYGDFIDQLQNNQGNYRFYTKLFPAVMQGEETVPTILEALEKISVWISFFDAVVIIRGGGSKLDLSSFDDYDLGYYITQFPLPVITGIGHEQDDTIVDIVAWKRCKTPTAVAEFLIDRVEEFDQHLAELARETGDSAQETLNSRKNQLAQAAEGLRLRIRNYSGRKLLGLVQYASRSVQSVRNYTRIHSQRLDAMEQAMKLNDPRRLLSRGYSITLAGGKLLKSKSQVNPGDRILTMVSDGEIGSTVEMQDP